MTHDELISVAWYAVLPYLDRGQGRLRTFESNLTATREIPDIISIGDNEDECIVIECKATRKDFLADRKKPFRVYPQMGMGKYRAYVVNEGVVRDPCELPEGWMCFVVIDANTVWEMAGPGSDRRAKDPRDWWRVYEHKERNWRAEYVTWKTIDWWQNKQDYLEKTPDPIGVDQMRLRFLDGEGYAVLKAVRIQEERTGRKDLRDKIIWDDYDRRAEVGREYYFLRGIGDLRPLYEGHLEHLLRSQLREARSWPLAFRDLGAKPFIPAVSKPKPETFLCIIPVEDAPEPDGELVE